MSEKPTAETAVPKQFMCYATNSSTVTLEVKVVRRDASGERSIETVYVQPGGRPKLGVGASIAQEDLIKYAPYLTEHQVEFKE